MLPHVSMKQDLPTVERTSASNLPEVRWEVGCIRLGHQMGDVGEAIIPKVIIPTGSSGRSDVALHLRPGYSVIPLHFGYPVQGCCYHSIRASFRSIVCGPGKAVDQDQYPEEASPATLELASQTRKGIWSAFGH
jgi:hypothetical protein